MAYVTTNPPKLVVQNIGGNGPNIWTYASEDGAAATVDAANYFTNGGSLGMKVGDIVFVTDTNASPVITTIHQVSATGDGTTDLNDLTTITQTDSD
jgi:hypothetical protein